MYKFQEPSHLVFCDCFPCNTFLRHTRHLWVSPAQTLVFQAMPLLI